MVAREFTHMPKGHGDSVVTEKGDITIEDWTDLSLSHICIRIPDDTGGYYLRTINLERAKEEDWLYVPAE